MTKIYSSLSRKKEEFKPLKEKELKMYACGVTPYDNIHIGHARQAVVYDVIRSYFEHIGYKVTYVRNFTDIDDKIIKRANAEGKETKEISEHFIEENTKDTDSLKVRRADFEPKATECIPDIIAYIEVLIAKGFAYSRNGEVFFDIDKYKEYGKLSNRVREELVNSEVSENKNNPNDFVLWKPQKPGEPAWESPWGPGRPGWHIECSVMANKFLGEEIDIHGGGLDLIFPHHENELAQSEAYSGKPFARYWIHNGLVMIDGVKMSKSLGNFLTVKDALLIYFPEEIRFAILSHQLSSGMDFSKELFLNARKRLYYFYSTLLRMSQVETNTTEAEAEYSLPPHINDLDKMFIREMEDNFNTPRVISALGEVFKELNQILDSKKISLAEKKYIFRIFREKYQGIAKVLHLFEEDPSQYLKSLKSRVLKELGIDENYIEIKLQGRQAAKEVQDFAKADSIKEELLQKGIQVLDTPEGARWDLLFKL
jgi:cysteinyl-tRNA synthetase